MKANEGLGSGSWTRVGRIQLAIRPLIEARGVTSESSTVNLMDQEGIDMITATFKVNGQDFRVMLNNNEELSANNSGLTDAQRTLIQSLPRAEGSTVSQYKVKVDDLVVNGNTRTNGLLKLAASMIQDANMKAAVRASHHSGTATSCKPDADVVDEWKQAMQELDLKKYPNLVKFFGVEDPIEAAVKALMTLGFTEEAARATVAAKK